MHTRTTTATLLLTAGLLLTGCASSSHDDASTPATTASAAPTPTSRTDYIHACTRAIEAHPAAAMPDVCNALTSDDYFAALSAAKPAKHPTAASTGAPLPDSPLATGSRTGPCWQAIRAQYEPGTMQLTGAPTEPPACLGLSTDEVSAIATDVLEHQSDG
jgi:hypothetical protein